MSFRKLTLRRVGSPKKLVGSKILKSKNKRLSKMSRVKILKTK